MEFLCNKDLTETNPDQMLGKVIEQILLDFK